VFLPLICMHSGESWLAAVSAGGRARCSLTAQVCAKNTYSSALLKTLACGIISKLCYNNYGSKILYCDHVLCYVHWQLEQRHLHFGLRHGSGLVGQSAEITGCLSLGMFF